MIKLLRVAVLLAALTVVGATAAAAGNAMKASLPQGSIVGFNQDPDALAARCPPGYPQAIVQSVLMGVFTSEAYTGPVTASSEHCSLLLVVTEHDLAVIQIDAGVLTLRTPGGDELYATYKAPGVFTGDLTLVGPNQHRANGPYTITGGTGVFSGASGHGHLGILGGSEGGTWELNGSLRLPG
jgi:hypothetical protein